jgi:hypothetical protein
MMAAWDKVKANSKNKNIIINLVVKLHLFDVIDYKQILFFINHKKYL